MKQTYIEWLYSGIITSETSAEKVKDRTMPTKFPKSSFGFRFYERTEMKTEDGELLIGVPQNYSGWNYIGGEELTLEEVKNRHPEKTILISNMECNSWDSVVLTRYGQAMPLGKYDVVLKPEGLCGERFKTKFSGGILP